MNNNVVNSNRIKESIYYKFGFEIFGPFLFGFTKWLYDEISKDEIDTLLFLSRDGYMMHKAYDFLSDDGKAQIRYFYCSRKSLRMALLWKYDSYEEMISLVSKTKIVSLSDMLDLWGFNKDERTRLAIDYGVKLDYYSSFDDLFCNDLFKKIFDENKEIIMQKSKKQNQYLIEYLNNIISGDHCGIVDIGWHGSMQYYLEQIAEINGLQIDFTGYYVGISLFYKLKGKIKGYLFEKEDDKLRRKVLCSHGLLEKLFQSQEGSAVGYNCKNDFIDVVKEDYEYADDEVVQKCIDDWQEGAMDFLSCNKSELVDSDSYRLYANRYISFGMRPSLMDIEVFRFLYNYDGQKNYYISRKSILRYKWNELWCCLNYSPWKTGFLKSLFKIPFPYFGIYRMVSK